MKVLGDVDERAVEPLLVGIEMALEVDVEAVGEEALEAGDEGFNPPL